VSLPPLPSVSDRLLAALRALIRQETQDRLFGLYGYSIVGTSGATINATPTDTSIGLPPITNLPLQPGLLGESVTPPPAGACLVAFINGDRQRPCVVGIGSIGIAATIDATGPLTIGKTSPVTAIGALPFAVASAPGLVIALAAVNAAIGAISTAIQGMTNGYSSLSPSQQNAFTTAMTTVNTALTTGVAAPPPAGVTTLTTQAT
jgi:hypothetical protein